jgi:hypothetical protein
LRLSSERRERVCVCFGAVQKVSSGVTTQVDGAQLLLHGVIPSAGRNLQLSRDTATEHCSATESREPDLRSQPQERQCPMPRAYLLSSARESRLLVLLQQTVHRGQPFGLHLLPLRPHFVERREVLLGCRHNGLGRQRVAFLHHGYQPC